MISHKPLALPVIGTVMLLLSACGRREQHSVSPPVWDLSPSEHSIGIRTGSYPLVWSEPDPRLTVNPVLTARDATDVAAAFVAAPFMVRHDGIWHMFFETFDAAVNRGVISWATSNDGFRWNYERVVLREPFHLSFPNVFMHDDQHLMIVESHQEDSIRLYRADPFPSEWKFAKTLLRGEHVGNTIFESGNLWWMMTSPRTSDRLRLFHAPEPVGPWVEHPLSPVISGNTHIARSGGRVIPWDGKLIRYLQVCRPMYGNSVHAFVIEELTTSTYRETSWPGNPVLKGSGTGWNALGMHHIDAHRLQAGNWIAVVNGITRAQPDHSLEIEFANGARLLGFNVRPPRRSPGEAVLLRFFWKDLPEFGEMPPALFVHIRGSGFTFQGDHHLANGREVYDHVVTVPPEAPPGLYRIWVGLYDSGSGERHGVTTRLPRRRNAVVLPAQLEVAPAAK